MTHAYEKYHDLCREIAKSDARLVTVSKTHPVEKIRELYEMGQRDFGENRVSELAEKYQQLPKDINWHFIGHLQRNKVKDVISMVNLVHSGDSLRLLRELDKRADGKAVDVLLQYHIADEESKYGLSREDGLKLLDTLKAEPLRHVRLVGVMGMATYTDDEEQVQMEFRTLHEYFSEVKAKYFADDASFREISMGMSGDYKIALKQGSTLVRIGSLIFGEREN